MLLFTFIKRKQNLLAFRLVHIVFGDDGGSGIYLSRNIGLSIYKTHCRFNSQISHRIGILHNEGIHLPGLQHSYRNHIGVKSHHMNAVCQFQIPDCPSYSQACPFVKGDHNIHLLYSGLKEEPARALDLEQEGTFETDELICSVQKLKRCTWKVVGVSYVSEMVTTKAMELLKNICVIFTVIFLVTVIVSMLMSRLVTHPIQRLIQAMGDFERNAAEYVYQPVTGTMEISALSQSFEHMVGKIQNLMNQVRQEEISLRKTELKALQAQINPHFLYNTLDAIGWLCEAERCQDAVEMVNALAKLFRISISKGHELITIEKLSEN